MFSGIKREVCPSPFPAFNPTPNPKAAYLLIFRLYGGNQEFPATDSSYAAALEVKNSV